jgi:alpha-glucosidase
MFSVWLIDTNFDCLFHSSGTAGNLSDTTTPISLPGDPGNLVVDYPEGYNSALWGTSGNLTINGTFTYQADAGTTALSSVTRRDLEKRAEPERDVNEPPYTINNGPFALILMWSPLLTS